MPPDYEPWNGFDAEHEAYETLVQALRAYAEVRAVNGHRMWAVKKDLQKIVENL